MSSLHVSSLYLPTALQSARRRREWRCAKPTPKRQKSAADTDLHSGGVHPPQTRHHQRWWGRGGGGEQVGNQELALRHPWRGRRRGRRVAQRTVEPGAGAAVVRCAPSSSNPSPSPSSSMTETTAGEEAKGAGRKGHASGGKPESNRRLWWRLSHACPIALARCTSSSRRCGTRQGQGDRRRASESVRSDSHEAIDPSFALLLVRCLAVTQGKRKT